MPVGIQLALLARERAPTAALRAAATSTPGWRSTRVVVCLGVWALAGGGYFWPVVGRSSAGASRSACTPLVELGAQSERRALAPRMEQLTRSRAGVVDARDDELRRIERDLHDGAQARLVAVAMNLGLAEDRLDRDPDGARELVAEAQEQARTAIRSCATWPAASPRRC